STPSAKKLTSALPGINSARTISAALPLVRLQQDSAPPAPALSTSGRSMLTITSPGVSIPLPELRILGSQVDWASPSLTAPAFHTKATITLLPRPVAVSRSDCRRDEGMATGYWLLAVFA